MGPFEILCGIAVVILAVYYYYLTYNFDYWKSRGIRGPRPVPVFGTTKDVMLAKQTMGDYLMQVYNEYKDESMIGIFTSREPVLLVKTPELIKDVLIKDFSKFCDRGIKIYKKETLSQHLVNLEPERWRPLRIKLTPAFTSGKLKEMFSLISMCADKFEQYVEKLASQNEIIECRELTAKYTTDVIGTCAFGIEMNALSDEDSKFREMGREIFAPTWINLIQFRLRRSMPWLLILLSYVYPLSQIKINKFFMHVLMQNMEYREKNNIVRHDFVDILRELKKNPDKMPNIDLTESFLASQAFVFFAAGFETSSTTMSHALYELALNGKIQDTLRKEIKEITKHNSDLTYENIKSMTYLNKVFKETLRKYPPALFLMRQSTEPYTFDGTSVTIPKDQKVWIPIYAIHRDPDIYPSPDVFDPERFDEETSRNRNAMFYLPFGDGPRNCIGARFATFQTKIGLIKLLQNYKVETCEKTRPYVNDPKSFLLAPKHGIHLKISKVN